MTRTIDLGHQVSERLHRRNGGTDNPYGWGSAIVIPMGNQLTTGPLALGTLVQHAYTVMVKPTTTTDDAEVLGVVVGYYRVSDGKFIADDCPVSQIAAVMVRGICKVLIGADVVVGEYAFAHATDGTAYSDATVAAGAFGRFLTNALVADGLPALMMVGLHGGGGGGGPGGSSPLTTAGDLYGYDTADARVPIGSNGQFLTVDTSDAQKLAYITHNNTGDPHSQYALDSDLTAYIAKSIVTNKGDVISATGSGVPVRVGVGTNGQILASRSGATPGVAWEDTKGELLVMFTSPVNGSLSKPMRVPFDCTLTGWYLVGNAAGSVVLDIWKNVFGSYPPVVANTIIGGGGTKPTLSTARTNSDTTLTSYSVSWTEGDWILVNVDSVSGLTEVVLALAVKRR